MMSFIAVAIITIIIIAAAIAFAVQLNLSPTLLTSVEEEEQYF
jgi:hypothetical protein